LIKTIGNLLNPENVHLRRTVLGWAIGVLVSAILAFIVANNFPGPSGKFVLNTQDGGSSGHAIFSGLGIEVLIAGFVFGFFDATLGMGYGTTLTPLLMIFGFSPSQIVPAILLSQFVMGLTGGFMHHRVGNVDFTPGGVHFRVAAVLGICSVVGSVAAVVLAVRLSETVLGGIIGILVIAAGITILATIKARFGFSWRKIAALGILAAFNKGISGGGYGPVVTGGQMLAGLEPRNAVGITSLAEGLTCLVGFIIYIILKQGLDCSLAPALVIGGMLCLPFSAWTVKRLPMANLKLVIGVVTLGLGMAALWTVLR